MKIVRDGESFHHFKKNSSTLEFPRAFADYTRSHGDVYFWPTGGLHVVTKASLAKIVLTAPEFSADRSSFFISRMPNIDLSLLKDFFGVVGRMMVMSDDKAHTARRGVASAGLNEALLNFYRPMIEAASGRLLEPLGQRGEIEFVEEVARLLPQEVLADLFQIPEADRAFFNRCSGTMTGFFGGAVEYTNDVAQNVNSAAISIRDYFRDLIKERRRQPKNDFFAGMLAMQKEMGLDEDELISQAVMMLVAGQVTTTDQLCNILYGMMADGGTTQVLRENPALQPSALEEFTRLDPAVTFIFRVARAPFQLGPQPILPGDTIFLANHAISRDASEVAEPDKIILDRKVNRHFAYGHGAHYCVGARLGRMEMGILIRQMLERFPNLRLEQERPGVRDHYSASFSGFKTMHLRA